MRSTGVILSITKEIPGGEDQAATAGYLALNKLIIGVDAGMAAAMWAPADQRALPKNAGAGRIR